MEKPYQLLQPVFKDHRGSFTPIKLSDKRVQSNISINDDIFVFRGLHYQDDPMAQSKLVSVIQGKVIDFVINLDKDSEDFGKLETFILTSGESVYVPKGYAHGILTLEDDTVVQYFTDNVYSPEKERSILWSSVPGLEDSIREHLPHFTPSYLTMSEKDTNGIHFSEVKLYSPVIE